MKRIQKSINGLTLTLVASVVVTGCQVSSSESRTNYSDGTETSASGTPGRRSTFIGRPLLEEPISDGLWIFPASEEPSESFYIEDEFRFAKRESSEVDEVTVAFYSNGDKLGGVLSMKVELTQSPKMVKALELASHRTASRVRRGDVYVRWTNLRQRDAENGIFAKTKNPHVTEISKSLYDLRAYYDLLILSDVGIQLFKDAIYVERSFKNLVRLEACQVVTGLGKPADDGTRPVIDKEFCTEINSLDNIIQHRNDVVSDQG